MKKQKFIKLTAFASTPSLENSFSAPETHNGEISVVFSGKNVKIHGWDGSAWSVIYTWNSVDKQYTFNNTFESYFLESLTGGDETMGVSFFSISRYQGSTPTLAGVNRDVKLYDVDEVPIYTPSDAGKMLTIMSDGSLRWLGASVTWMIDGSPVPVTVGPGSGVEDSGGVTLFGNTTLNDGVLSFDGSSYATISDGFAFTDNLTLSVWFKTTATGDRRILSSHVRSGSPFLNGYFIRLNNGQLKYRHPAGGASEWTGPSGLNDGAWHHVALTWEANVGFNIYVDGVNAGSGTSGAADGYMTGWDLYVGANPWNGSNPYAFFVGEIDNIQIENQTMTEAEVLSIYDAGRAEESIWLEENENLSLGTNHALVNGILEVNMVGSSNWSWNNVSYHDWSLVAPEPTYTGTYSVWFKKTGDSYKGTAVNNDLFIVNGFQNAVVGLGLKIKNGTQVQIGGAISYPYPYSQGIGTLSESVNNGNWHHIVVSVSLDELDQTVVQAVVDGVAGPSLTVSKRNIGSAGANVRSIFGASPAVGPQLSSGHFDAAQFVADTALTEAQMLALYNAGQGGMSIEEASAL